MAVPMLEVPDLTPAVFHARAACGYQQVAARLQEGFDTSAQRTIGAEVEGGFFTRSAKPAFIADRVLDAPDIPPDVVAELLKCYFEINLHPIEMVGAPFSAFTQVVNERTTTLTRLAAAHDGKIGFMGIAPTMTAAMLNPSNYSANPRYTQLRQWAARHSSAGTNRLGPVAAKFTGNAQLDIEGANTSLQVHISVRPEELTDMFNAAHLALPYVLAVCGGSPYLLGKRWGAETRIPVFEQATVGRAFFGDNWATSNLDPFRWSMAYEPILTPDVSDVAAFKLLHGTVWRWIRAVMFDEVFTIEIRPLSTGPTVTDMAANAAFVVGLVLHFYRNINQIKQKLPLARVRDSFYEAARKGLQAQFGHDHSGQPGRATAVSVVLPELIDQAQGALIAHGVTPAEASMHLNIIRYRLDTRQTAAHWLDLAIAQYGAEAATALYLQHSQNGIGPAVATWPRP